MATIRICDICYGKLTEDDKSFDVITKVKKRGETDWKVNYYDICPECMEKINTALSKIVEEARKDA